MIDFIKTQNSKCKEESAVVDRIIHIAQLRRTTNDLKDEEMRGYFIPSAISLKLF